MERHISPTSPARQVIRVAVKDESELVVRGIQAMLAPYADQVVVLPARPDQPTPLSDLTLYEPSRHRGVATDRSVPRRFPTRMVAYSWDCSAQMVSTEMALGAAGYISKWLPARRLVRDLLQLADGRVVVDAWEGRQEPEVESGHAFRLTQRETDVLSLIAAGRSNQDIALQEHISINSVKSYIRSAYAKIEVTSRSQAVLWAIRHGLLLPAAAGRDAVRVPAPAPVRAAHR